MSMQFDILHKTHIKQVAIVGNDATLTITCHMCGVDYRVPVDKDSWIKYIQGGTPIQECFFVLSADERELIISGTCGACWDELWVDED